DPARPAPRPAGRRDAAVVLDLPRPGLAVRGVADLAANLDALVVVRARADLPAGRALAGTLLAHLVVARGQPAGGSDQDGEEAEYACGQRGRESPTARG